MGIEIERKFLVTGEAWRSLSPGTLYRQGYIRTQGSATVRVRIAGETGYLTLKGPTRGLSRLEFEYEIPLAEAQQLLDELCDRPLIEKYRYPIQIGELTWEIDEFIGENQGLILAEVELTDPEQPVDCPAWIGTEVSGDSRYFNSNLAKTPFSQWGTVTEPPPS
ncbi:MAG: CYTH domain-containing protein [Cyanothece sp. SIO2G6]|nr:CYTH domain-containing protein [Cyanothece sp. SIO2G6]